MTAVIGIDVGGTKISAAFIVDDEIRAEAFTEYSRKTLVSDLGNLYNDLVSQNSEPQAVGVCSAGLVDSEMGIVKFAGNLDLVDFPLVAELSRVIKKTIFLENDARAALWGEYKHQTNNLGENCAAIVLGTGIGGGLVISGRLVRGSNGFAGEFGHLPIPGFEDPCACGQVGCFEAVASGRGIENFFFRSSQVRLSAKEIVALAKEGQSLANDCLERVGLAVGEVVSQLSCSLDLDTVLIGGGFGSTYPMWVETAQSTAKNRLLGRQFRDIPRLVPAKLGNKAGLVGVGLLASA